MKLDVLKNNPLNPRTIKDADFYKLVDSLLRDPMFLEPRPIVVNEDNIVMGGNQRFKALKHISKWTIPQLKESLQGLGLDDNEQTQRFKTFSSLIETGKINDKWVISIANCTGEQIKRFVLLDNKSTGKWDIDMLENQFTIEELDIVGINLDDVLQGNSGYSENEDYGDDDGENNAAYDDADYSKKNKEYNDDDFEDSMKLVLNYTAAEYEAVKEAISHIGGTPEKVLWNLLKLDNNE